jgi:hypothetical protein
MYIRALLVQDDFNININNPRPVFRDSYEVPRHRTREWFDSLVNGQLSNVMRWYPTAEARCL